MQGAPEKRAATRTDNVR